jgi:hypothetical protein
MAVGFKTGERFPQCSPSIPVAMPYLIEEKEEL